MVVGSRDLSARDLDATNLSVILTGKESINFFKKFSGKISERKKNGLRNPHRLGFKY